MPDDKIMVVRREEPAKNNIRFKGVIELPAEMPPQPDYEEPEGPGPASEPIDPEVVSEAEQKYYESNKERPPANVVTSAPMTKDSIVTPIDVETKAFWVFLDALSNIVEQRDDYPILAGVKISFIPGEQGCLMLEANNQRIWAAATLKAWDGAEAFECVLPIQRTLNILNLLATQYKTVAVGMDKERVHLGSFSFPFYGFPEHFPKKPPLEAVLADVVLATRYLKEIPERVMPALVSPTDSMTSRGLSSVFLDLKENTAVATNGTRMHVLELPMMQVRVEDRWKDIPDKVRLPVELCKFVHAVEEREWTGIRVGETKLMVGHEDFGMIAERGNEPHLDWKKAMPEWPGTWTVDLDAFLATMKEASLILANEKQPYVDLAFDLNERNIAVSSSSEGTTFDRAVAAKPSGRMLSFLVVRLNPILALDAIDACRGTSLRMHVGRDMDPILFRGDDNCFTAIVMPMRRE